MGIVSVCSNASVLAYNLCFIPSCLLNCGLSNNYSLSIEHSLSESELIFGFEPAMYKEYYKNILMAIKMLLYRPQKYPPMFCSEFKLP